MPFIEKRDHKDVYHLGDYHPYRIGGYKNPSFDGFSARILDIKQEEPKEYAINWFYNQLNQLFKEGIAITVVPSHDPEATDSGIRRIGELLAKNGRIDATSCLVRHALIAKLATGGNRNKEVHEKSLKVVKNRLIFERNVLILDDVTTSHNSILVCKDLILKAGAAKVTCFALGHTVH